LNPVSFNPDELPKIRVEVEGTITINNPTQSKVDDVAVMWLINRTKSVNVTEFTITRPQMTGESDESYAYPKTFTQPSKGTSLATYHTPMETPYSIVVKWARDDGSEAGEWRRDVQFPRAQDYRFYLYRTASSGGGVIVVDENEMKEMPDPNDTTSDPADPAIIDAQTFVVINVTPDQPLGRLDFVKPPNTYSVDGEPLAKDQKMILLAAGSYRTTAVYTRDGTPRQTTPKNIIVTRETGSMAVRTNYVYFYKTTAGDYQLSQVWPPIPNDAADDNSPEDALLETQGILEIVNNATTGLDHAIITRVRINGAEYPDDTNNSPYIIIGDTRRYIVDAGTAVVAFQTTDRASYGMNIPRIIAPRAVTTLVYTNGLAAPETIPQGEGYGSGLIRITNMSTAVVVSVDITDRTDASRLMSIGYGDFNSKRPIGYREVDTIPVVGTIDFPLTDPGPIHFIQVSLESPDGVITVERLVALSNKIVDILITQDDILVTNRKGSKVTVRNATTSPTIITALGVYNKANTASNTVYNMTVVPGASQDLYVLSSPSLPITDSGQRYAAQLTVSGNGNVAVINKDFAPDDSLYSDAPDSHVRTVTLDENDVPSGLKEPFIPLTSLTVSGGTLRVTSSSEYDPADGQIRLKTGGTLNLNSYMVFNPSNATARQIEWSVEAGAGLVTVNSQTGLLTVTGIGTTATVRATIQNAQGTVGAKTSYTETFPVTLLYNQTTKSYPVTGINLPSSASVQAGNSLNLAAMATLQPWYANNSGVPITVRDLEWAVLPNALGSSVGPTGLFTAGPTSGGPVTVRATLPAGSNGTGGTKTADIAIMIVAQPPNVVRLDSIALTNNPLVVTSTTVTDPITNDVTLVTGGRVNLNDYVVFNPANATHKILSWSDPPDAFVTVTPGTTGGVLTVTGVAPSGTTVSVSVTAQNIDGNGLTLTVLLPIELRYINTISSNPVPSNGISLTMGTVAVGQTLNMRTLARLPPNAHIQGVPITVDDLVWTIESGGSYGTLSGTGNQVITGRGVTNTSQTVSVRATLPAAKNGGTAVFAITTITVTPPPHPDYLTLRVIKDNNVSDRIRGVYLVKTTDTYSDAVKRTGHTQVAWATATGWHYADPSYKSQFEGQVNKYGRWGGPAYVTYYDFGAKGPYYVGDWRDVTIPWPTSGGYYLFFLEADSRVRGYAHPLKMDPPKATNYLFYLDPDTLLSLSLDMIGTSEMTTSGTTRVVPIGYNTYYNSASIMKSQGPSNKPRHDLSDLP
jgi:hypothetical protein